MSFNLKIEFTDSETAEKYPLLNKTVITAKYFHTHFFEMVNQNINPSDVVSVQINDQKKSLDWLLHLFSSIRKYELQMKEDGNRSDNWGNSILSSINKTIPKSISEMEQELYWFQIGQFDEHRIWQVDKHQIQAILYQESDDRFLHLCPSYDRNAIDESVDRLPDKINVTRSPSWEIRYENQLSGSKVMKKPIGVIHKLTLDTLIEPREKQLKKEVSQNLESINYEKVETENKERTRRIPKTSFNEVGGIEDIITTVREVIELPLKNPGLFSYLNISPHKGVLLHGPPGCGKTMIAKAIANDIHAHFISVKGPELLNKYHGQSEENLRQLFEEASEMQPSIIFFDEIDAIAQKRSSEDNLRIEAKFVNQLLTMMDGIEDYGNVCVIAATNRPELLDSALLRPGRFDYQLHVPKPNKEGCKKIFEINVNKMPVSEKFQFQEFSDELEGLTGAEIAFVAREGAYNCLRRNFDLGGNEFDELMSLTDYSSLTIEESDFKDALKRVKNSE